MAIQRSVFLSAAAIAALALQLSGYAWAEVNQLQWEAYSAQEFADAAGEAFKSPGLSEADQQLVTQMAWNRFLTDESFVARGDLKVVRALVNQFAARRSALVYEKVSAEQVESQFAALKGRLTERLKGSQAELKAIGVYELNDLTKSLGMASSGSLEKAELFVDWMETSEWRSLPLIDRYNLYSFINADAVDRRQLSARWTGTLTAPKTGRYILRQAPQYSGTDCRVKIYLGDEVVLDSSDPALGEQRFEGKPIELTASQALPIRVEMRHQVSRIDWSEGAPMVVVSWQINDSPLEIIPELAFTPPEGFGEAGARGLKGEYFGDTELRELKATRLDPALDLVSSWPPAIAVHHEQADAVFQACVDDVLNDAVLAEAGAEGNEEFFHYSLWRIAYRMTATDRVKLVESLLRNPEAIALMTPEAMGRLMQAIYMLPGKEHLALFGEWASIRPQPRIQPGEFSGWGKGFYQELNTDYYWLMGLFLQGPYWSDVDTLWSEHLVREKGECNLAIAYATAYATQEQAMNGDGRLVRVYFERIKRQLDDETTTGDNRVSWLLAWAYGKEVMVAGAPHLLTAPDFLTEAQLVAESPEYQFWATGEAAARYASLGDVEALDKLLGQRRGQSAEQDAAMAAWRQKAEQLQAVYAKKTEAAQARSDQSFEAELKRRLAESQQRGDKSEAARYQLLLEASQLGQVD